MKFAKIWFVAMFLLLTACGSPGQIETPSSAENHVEEVEKVEPVNIDVTLDNSHAVSAVIPIAGGSLTATGADGTTYTLDIPDDALLYDTEITMTPLESVSGMPPGFEAGPGVQLEPDGLSFFNFATLTITPADEIPMDQQIFFGYEADGQNLSLALPEIDSSEIKIQLLHFTGYFVGTGNLGNVAAALPVLGGAVVRELNNRIAELTHRERQRQKIEGRKPLAPEYYSELAKIFQEYYDSSVKPRLDTAGESCAGGRLAIIIYGHYIQLMRKAGLIDSIVEIDLLALVEKAQLPCLQEEYNLCVQDHIIHRMIPFLLGLDRQMQLTREALGLGEESASSSALLQQARQLTEKCLRFELEFKSTSTGPAFGGDAGGSGIIEVTVSANVPIRFDAATFQLSGEAPLVHGKFLAFDKLCATVTYPASGGFEDGTFKVYSLTRIVEQSKLIETEKLVFKLNDLHLLFNADSRDLFMFAGNCSFNQKVPPDQSSHWDGVFQDRHSDQFCGVMGTGGPRLEALCSGSTGIYIFEGWQIVGEELFAVLEWQKEGYYTESGSFLLYHRPGN
ncbi:MAG: hypothetical protein WEC16_01675 [Anaerolineales bacterium]